MYHVSCILSDVVLEEKQMDGNAHFVGHLILKALTGILFVTHPRNM